jgi:hypothetical protein
MKRVRKQDAETQLLPREEVRGRAFRNRTRRDFLALGVGAAALVGGWRWVLGRPQVDEVPGPLRHVLDMDGRISQRVLGTRRLARTFPVDAAVKDLRVNGVIGMNDLDLDKWRLQVFGLPNAQRFPQFSQDAGAWDYGLAASDASEDASSSDDKKQKPKEDADGLSYGSSSGAIPQSSNSSDARQPGLLLTLDDLKKLPYYETVTELKCIEGWSEIAHWGGARMADFLDAYGAPAMKYVGFETPSADFYASQDMATMRHPQTLLAYSMNGEMLSPQHGAPLRLATPLKYGYKQIKQVSKIFFSDERPRDYWVENGYDWYGGH